MGIIPELNPVINHCCSSYVYRLLESAGSRAKW